VVVVVNVGDGIYFRRPGFKTGRKVSKERTISEVLAELNKEFGLGMPVFVFGYWKLCRGLSIRSLRRVPTHFVIFLGNGISIENYTQALGRGTFNGIDSVLKKNGHAHVTVLTSKDDFNGAKKYIKFLDLLHDRLEQGESPEEAITGAKGKFPDSANFLRHFDKRRIGQRKNLKAHLNEEDLFEEPVDDDDDDEYSHGTVFEGDHAKQQRYWNDNVAQRVLRSFLDLKEEDREFSCTVKQIITKFNDTYQDDGVKMTKVTLKKILDDYEKNSIVE